MPRNARQRSMFESDVIPDGGQWPIIDRFNYLWFESDVIPDGGHIKIRQY